MALQKPLGWWTRELGGGGSARSDRGDPWSGDPRGEHHLVSTLCTWLICNPISVSLHLPLRRAAEGLNLPLAIEQKNNEEVVGRNGKNGTSSLVLKSVFAVGKSRSECKRLPGERAGEAPSAAPRHLGGEEGQLPGRGEGGQERCLSYSRAPKMQPF